MKNSEDLDYSTALEFNKKIAQLLIDSFPEIVEFNGEAYSFHYLKATIDEESEYTEAHF